MTMTQRLAQSMRARAALMLVFGYALLAWLGPWCLDANALALDPLHELQGPSSAAWLGRAENGVSVAAALVVGARTSLSISFFATALSLVFGALAGALAALFGGRLDALFMRGLDVLSAFPGILLAIYLAAVLPPSTLTLVLALSVTGWVGFARVARTSVQKVLALDHVTAAHAIGAPRPRVLWAHVAPLAFAPLVVQGSFALSTNILAEASLSFLGLGAPPGTPTWGGLLDEGVTYLLAAPHLALFPGICVSVAVLAFHVLGDALLDVLDVTSGPRAR